MRNIFKNSVKALLFIFFMTMTQNAIAQAKVDDATVTVGATTTINLPLTYRNTLNRSTGIVYNWTTSDNSISISSHTREKVIIKGNSASSTAKVYYKCSYYIDGFYRTMNFYWDVTVKSNIVYVTKIELNLTSATLEEGESIHIYATCYPTNATNKNVSWSSDDTSVATVDTYGNVTAVSAGKATVTCRSQQKTTIYSTCDITVMANDQEPEPEKPAQGKSIVIKPYDKECVRLVFAEEPTVIIKEGKVTVTISNTTIEYEYADIESITFEDETSENIKTQTTPNKNIIFSGNTLCVERCEKNGIINIYGIDGSLVLTSVCDTDGASRIDLSALPPGKYMVKSGKSTIKIYKH